MKLGFIGGSGLYAMDALQEVQRVQVSTPFGEPSDAFTTGILSGMPVVFLPRHGVGHRLLPGELNHRANIFAMKTLGVTHLVSLSAVGSLQEKYAPRDIVLVDQYVDRTKRGLDHTFFGEGVVAHISFGDPVCHSLHDLVADCAQQTLDEVYAIAKDDKPKLHRAGTYLNMEGPAFSTKAESRLYRSWGMDVIGMTNLAEAKLAREAEICYCTVAMVTDYDCWHPHHDEVSVDLILANLKANAAFAQQLICNVSARAEHLPASCSCQTALKYACITDPSVIPYETRRRLKPILGKYFPVSNG